MSRLVWRIAVVLVLAVILGSALGLLNMALWTTQREQAELVAMVLNGSVPLIAILLSLWASEATP